MSEDKKPRLKEGPPIWIESTLSPTEWSECYKKYTTYAEKQAPQFFKSDYEWRWNMGKNLSSAECNNINNGIEKLRLIIQESLLQEVTNE